jgi:hypothetical protein
MKPELKDYSIIILNSVDRSVSELAELASESEPFDDEAENEWLANMIQLHRALIRFCKLEIAEAEQLLRERGRRPPPDDSSN